MSLTPMQEGMFFDYLGSPGSSRYFEQLSLTLLGEIDRQAIEAAWNVVIETNEMLRAVYRWEKIKEPVQVILKTHPVDLRYYDLSGQDIHDQEKLLEKIKKADRAEAFDLRRVPFRVTLCQTAKNKAEMIISNHHILYDGWSNSIILKELLNAYDDILAHGQSPKINKSKFKDFLRWLQTRGNKDEQEKFWKHYLLRDSDKKIDIDKPGKFQVRRKKRESQSVSQYFFPFPGELNEKLLSFVKQHKITLSTLLTGGWGLLLREYNGVEDIIFNTTVSGRRAKIKGIEDMVGMFINTLPLRICGGTGYAA